MFSFDCRVVYNEGATLIKVGETERMIGIAERDLMDVASTSYLHPLKAFLDNDIKAYAVRIMNLVIFINNLLSVFAIFALYGV